MYLVCLGSNVRLAVLLWLLLICFVGLIVFCSVECFACDVA